MHVMVMMVVVVVMMMVHDRRLIVDGRTSGGSASGCFLREGVSAEAERQNGRGGKGLDHDKDNPVVGDPNGSRRTVETCA